MYESSLFETHFDLIPFGIYVVDVLSFEIVYINCFLKERFGNDIAGQLCYEKLQLRDQPCPHCKIGELLTPDGRPSNETVVFEHFNEEDDCWQQLHERAMQWPDGRTVKYSIIVDISELKEMQNRLAEAHAELAIKNRALKAMSETDPLTGVYNRLKLEEVLSREIEWATRYNRPFSIVLMDIDHFKRVNDTFGHPTGNMVLKAVARLMGGQIRKSDVYGRWGGEEFLIVAPETELHRAAVLAEGIRRRFASHAFEVAGVVTVSLGVASYQEGDGMEAIISRVDMALYRAKERGRNRVEVIPGV